MCFKLIQLKKRELKSRMINIIAIYSIYFSFNTITRVNYIDKILDNKIEY